MSEAVADTVAHHEYKLAWRWLLPAVAPARLEITGFSDAEESILRNSVQFMRPCCRRLSNRDALIVSSTSAGRDPEKFRLEFRSWIVVVGRGRQLRKWREKLQTLHASVTEYALLPFDLPRVAFPLTTFRSIRYGLRLHQPGRLLARIALGAAVALARIGVRWHLRGFGILIAEQQPELPQGAVVAGLPPSAVESEYALYFGNPDGNRKTVALVLEDGRVHTILKQSNTSEARQSLFHEASTLERLSSTALRSRIPTLRLLIQHRDFVTLHQEYRDRQLSIGGEFRNRVRGFLSDLSRLGRHRRPLSDALADCDVIDHGFSELQRVLYDRAERGALIWTHFSHGDFAPWNCSLTRKGLFVFDWEASTHDVAWSDAFYFSVAPSMHIPRRRGSPSRIMRRAVSFARDIASISEMDANEVLLHYAFWLYTHPQFTRWAKFQSLIELATGALAHDDLV